MDNISCFCEGRALKLDINGIFHLFTIYKVFMLGMHYRLYYNSKVCFKDIRCTYDCSSIFHLTCIYYKFHRNHKVAHQGKHISYLYCPKLLASRNFDSFHICQDCKEPGISTFISLSPKQSCKGTHISFISHPKLQVFHIFCIYLCYLSKGII